MSNYKGQANIYESNSNEIKAILEKVTTVTTDVDTMINETYPDSKNDYLMNQIYKKNENVIEDVDEIKRKLDIVSGDLQTKAAALDREEELKAEEQTEGEGQA